MKTKKITISVEITSGFDDEERKLPSLDRLYLKKELNRLVSDISRYGWSHRIYRSKNLIFPKTIKRENSSLYLFKANKKYGVVLSVDNDPIFAQKIVTLFRVTENINLQKAFQTTAELLYS